MEDSPLLQSIDSPPSDLNTGLSSVNPQFDTGFSRLETAAACIEEVVMENLEIRRNPDPGPRRSSSTAAIQADYKPQIIVVVVDITRELKTEFAALKYGLEISQPGDKLYLVGILHHVLSPMGYKLKADPHSFNGASRTFVEDEQHKKTLEFQQCMNVPELQKLFASKQISPIVQVVVGSNRKEVTARHAVDLQATWVILDTHLKNDQSYHIKHLNCNLILMKPWNQAVMIKSKSHGEQKPPRHYQNENRNPPPHQYQLPLDKSMNDGSLNTKIVVGEVVTLPGLGTPVLLTDPAEQVAGTGIKNQLSSRSIYSPPSHLTGHTPDSPSRYVDALPNSFPVETLASMINNFPMERPKTTHSTNPDQQMSCAIQHYKPRIFVVVVDATRELELAPWKYALEISEPRDKLYLLGIMHQVTNPMGYKQKADPSQFGGTNRSSILGEQRKKLAEYQGRMNDPQLQMLLASKWVNPVIQIAAGCDRKVVAAKQASKLQAEFVVMDKRLKNDKRYLMDNLNCHVILMTRKSGAVMIKFCSHEEQNLPSDYQFPPSFYLGPAPMKDTSLVTGQAL
ncbi:unnamed protein product [Calypogeia fissa]